MVFAMDVLDYFDSGSTVGPVGYVAMSVALLAMVITAMYFVVMFCIKICQSKTEIIKNTTELDFIYKEAINYKPYKKLNTFTLSWVAEMKLIDVGIFLNCFFYLISNTVAFYNLNQLEYNYTPNDFFS